MEAREIQPNDLRIGNLVHYGVNIVPIKSILTESVLKDEVCVYIELNKKLNHYCVDINEVEPIPLTEEWLEKLGWVWNEECKSYEGSDVRMYLEYRQTNNSYTMFNYVLKALICKRIFYVHQLQNLYFALTSQELTIK